MEAAAAFLNVSESMVREHVVSRWEKYKVLHESELEVLSSLCRIRRRAISSPALVCD